MTLSYTLHANVEIEVDREDLQTEFDEYRAEHPDWSDEQILRHMYICHYDGIDLTDEIDFWDFEPDIDQTEDDFVSMVQEELNLPTYPEDAEGQLHLF